ncbi:MAG: hypothetical protein A2Z11_03085, partial [Candidatus Woykebacteria bacterium RBG_16_43_9]
MKTEVPSKKSLELYASARVKRLQHKLKEKELNAFLVSAKSNRFYLTGWQGDEESGFLLLTPKGKYLITDSRYTEHATNLTDFQIVETNEGIGPALSKLAQLHKLKRIGFESHDISVFTISRLKKFLKGTKLVPVAHLVEELRSIKDETEIANIQKAASIADKAFIHILHFIKPGMTEIEIAWEMEKYMRGQGAEGMAWSPFIVAAGPNAAMAHWGASNSKIKKGDNLQLDYGCSYRGYMGDISRTVFVGKPSTAQTKIYNLVLEAQKLGLSLVKEGKSGGAIDRAVQKFLKKHLLADGQDQNIYRH